MRIRLFNFLHFPVVHFGPPNVQECPVLEEGFMCRPVHALSGFYFKCESVGAVFVSGTVFEVLMCRQRIAAGKMAFSNPRELES